jgi:hypothetical protein
VGNVVGRDRTVEVLVIDVLKPAAETADAAGARPPVNGIDQCGSSGLP